MPASPAGSRHADRCRGWLPQPPVPPAAEPPPALLPAGAAAPLARGELTASSPPVRDQYPWQASQVAPQLRRGEAVALQATRQRGGPLGARFQDQRASRPQAPACGGDQAAARTEAVVTAVERQRRLRPPAAAQVRDLRAGQVGRVGRDQVPACRRRRQQVTHPQPQRPGAQAVAVAQRGGHPPAATGRSRSPATRDALAGR